MRRYQVQKRETLTVSVEIIRIFPAKNVPAINVNSALGKRLKQKGSVSVTNKVI